ncbi:hypothetical protein OH76DRAFT_376905 [Lentinus brumalis]|uniref:Uncharacterized protein n=1 Tax=Lentinus brumalis TaxID=2498619 RepID=A0A371CIV3_9APHY|nr:hypothetical protein OH76DRAFT_376905 [Polyporus brumalis]
MIDPPLLRSARTHRTELPQSCTPGRRFFIDMRWTRNVELPMMVLTPLLSRGTWTEHDGFHTIVEGNTMEVIARHCGGTGPVRGTGDKSSVMGLSVPLPVCRLGRHADGHAIARRTVLGHVGPTSSQRLVLRVQVACAARVVACCRDSRRRMPRCGEVWRVKDTGRPMDRCDDEREETGVSGACQWSLRKARGGSICDFEDGTRLWRWRGRE